MSWSNARLTLVSKFISHSLKSLQILSKAPISKIHLPHFATFFLSHFFLLLKQVMTLCKWADFLSVWSTTHVAFQIVKVDVAPSTRTVVNQFDACALTDKSSDIPGLTSHRLMTFPGSWFDNLKNDLQGSSHENHAINLQTYRKRCNDNRAKFGKGPFHKGSPTRMNRWKPSSSTKKLAQHFCHFWTWSLKFSHFLSSITYLALNASLSIWHPRFLYYCDSTAKAIFLQWRKFSLKHVCSWHVKKKYWKRSPQAFLLFLSIA